MKENRALISYTKTLEGKTDKLREKLGIWHPVLDGGVSWYFIRTIFTLENPENLTSLKKYINKECLPHIKEIEEAILFLKTEGKKGKNHYETLDIRKNSDLAAEELAKCLERTGLDKNWFFEHVEDECKDLSNNYKELIELIEYLMK